MNARMIDHDEAVKSLMAERYLLGELNAAEREAYEEHMFSCDACFDQVKTGTEFVSHMRRIGTEKPQFALAAGFMSRFLANARHVVTITACVLLIGVSGISVYQRRIIGGLRQAQVTPSFFLSDGAKAGGVKQLVLPPNTRFDLSIQLLQRADFSSYEGQVLTESQQVKASFPISAEQTRDTIHVLLDSGVLGPGNYIMVVNSLAPDGQKTEITRYRFQILLKE
jgi:hypothetical protein